MKYLPSANIQAELVKAGLDQFCNGIDFEDADWNAQRDYFRSHPIHAKESDAEIDDRTGYFLIWRDHGVPQDKTSGDAVETVNAKRITVMHEALREMCREHFPALRQDFADVKNSTSIQANAAKMLGAQFSQYSDSVVTAGARNLLAIRAVQSAVSANASETRVGLDEVKTTVRDSLTRVAKIIGWGLGAIFALLLALVVMTAFSLRAHAQIDVIQFQDSSGTLIKTFAAPFKIKCSTNLTCTPTGSTMSITASASGATAFSGITAATNSNAGSFIVSGNTWDFSAATLLKMRIAAGLTSSVNGDLGYDTTNKNWHLWANAVDNFIATIPVSVTVTSGHLATWSLVSGVLTLNDGGAVPSGGTPCTGTASSVQYNNGGAFGCISTMTTDGTIVTAKVGADWLFVDPTGPTKKFSFDASNITAGQTRTVNIPDANSTTVQSDTGASNNFLTAISAQGVISKAQPAFTNLSGSAACSQMPALTGDVTTSAGACATTNVNLPDGVTQAGSLLVTDITAPSSPAAAHLKVFGDSTDLRFHDKNAAGTIGTTVVANTLAANNYVNAVSAAGVVSGSRPACATLSDSSGGCTMSTTAGGDLSGTLPSPTVAKVNGIAYSATAAAHTVEVITTANTTATAKVIPDCTDATGNHLNYTQSTDSFSCGTTDSHVGTVTSVSGTANEITSSGGATPTLSIASTFDIHGKTSTAPVKAGTTAGAPATCQASIELYVETDATAGQQLFICNATGNGWVLVGDGGGAGGGASTADSFITISHDADLTGERTLAGTSGDVTVTDGGANASVTLDTGANIPKVTTSNTYSASTTQGFDAITASKENGICIIDGVKNTTLANAITCAGSSGIIEVPPSAGTLSVPANATIPVGVTLRVDQGAVLSIANTFTLTINGPIQAGPYAIFAYVGSGTVALGWQEEVRAIWFPGADMIAEIVNAYKAAPAAPSLTKIIVDVNPAGGCWTATTAGVLNTTGKLARIQGSVPPGQAVGNNPAGACINYTPTSGIAFTLDWVPSDGSASPGPGITDLLLTHTLSYTVGGPSTDTSTALSCGSTNKGIGMADFYAFQVKGFNTGYSCATSLSFGMNFYASIWEFNGTGVSVTVQTEYINFIGGHFDGNGTPVSATDTNITFNGVNFDSNTKFSSYAGSANAQITYVSDRFENLNIGASSCGLNSAEYINSSGPTIVFEGGIATDDCNTGTNQDYWFTGNIIQIYGLSVSSAGRTVTNLFVINQRALGFLNNGSAAVLTGNLGLFPAASTVSVTGTGLTPALETVQVCLSGSVAAFLTCMQTAASPSGAATVTVPSGINTTLAGLSVPEQFLAEQEFAPTTSSVAPVQIQTQLVPPAAAPTLACSNSGGSLAAATHFFKIVFNNGAANMTTVSAEASCATTGASGSVVVTAPTLPTNATGYTVYDSNTTNTELQQAASNACVNISANCTVTVLAAGAAVPGSNTASACPTAHTAVAGEEYCTSSDGTVANNIEWHAPAPGTIGAIIIPDASGNTVTHTVNGTVTSYTVNHPLAAATGVLTGVNASNVITWAHSGDAAHSLSQLAKTAAVTTFTLCAATANTACGQAGQYRISYNFYGSGTACATVTAGSVGLNLTWTDTNAVTHTTISLPLWDQKSAAMTNGLFNFNTALGTEGASGSYIISTNGTIIQAATTYTACTSGTGTYNLKMTVEQLQ